MRYFIIPRINFSNLSVNCSFHSIRLYQRRTEQSADLHSHLNWTSNRSRSFKKRETNRSMVGNIRWVCMCDNTFHSTSNILWRLIKLVCSLVLSCWNTTLLRLTNSGCFCIMDSFKLFNCWVLTIHFRSKFLVPWYKLKNPGRL